MKAVDIGTALKRKGVARLRYTGIALFTFTYSSKSRLRVARCSYFALKTLINHLMIAVS